MKKFATFIPILLLIAGLNGVLTAQPQYYNYNTNGSGPNSFPFNIVSGKDVQLLYLPGDFNQPSPAPDGNITSISFLISSLYPLGPWTYANLTIKLGQSTITSFSGTSFYTEPLSTVYSRSSVTLTGAAGSWMTINLDSPFSYDPTKSLIVEVGQCGVPGAEGFSTTHTTLTGNRRIWSAGGCPFEYLSSNSFVVHLGLTIETIPILFDNGPVFNSTGTGAGGVNESIYYQGGTTSYGSGCQHTSGINVADDFTVPPGKTWAITSMDFFSYQTNSTTTSTINGIYVRIWNGRPGIAGSALVWGNMTTNRIAGTSFANVYRVSAANGGADRPCMRVRASTLGLILNAGSYWVEWSCTGTLASGPWVPPVVTEFNVTGNAIQTPDGGSTYTNVLYNSYAQGFPFILNGTETVYQFMIIQNIAIPYGQTTCYNATQLISVAGNGTSFNIENGGGATMIAGHNILYNPGTVVQNGGYLWGHIAPAGPYCLTPSMPSVAVISMPAVDNPSISSDLRSDMELSKFHDQTSFKIYPNPTYGDFILEFQTDVSDDVEVDIIDMRGKKVDTELLNGVRRHEFSIMNKPSGVYFIRVVSGSKAETAKLIKQNQY